MSRALSKYLEQKQEWNLHYTSARAIDQTFNDKKLDQDDQNGQQCLKDHNIQVQDDRKSSKWSKWTRRFLKFKKRSKWQKRKMV